MTSKTPFADYVGTFNAQEGDNEENLEALEEEFYILAERLNLALEKCEQGYRIRVKQMDADEFSREVIKEHVACDAITADEIRKRAQWLREKLDKLS